jgi:hypothetical protein
LNDEETETILKSAGDCAEGECSLDDVSFLIGELKEQEKLLQERMQSVTTMIGQLQHINEKEERKTDEVRAFVKDMLSVFNNGGRGFPTTGYPGDVGKGTTDAYDALKPKPWKEKSSN